MPRHRLRCVIANNTAQLAAELAEPARQIDGILGRGG